MCIYIYIFYIVAKFLKYSFTFHFNVPITKYYYRPTIVTCVNNIRNENVKIKLKIVVNT